jgi:hypothetical protein
MCIRLTCCPGARRAMTCAMNSSRQQTTGAAPGSTFVSKWGHQTAQTSWLTGLLSRASQVRILPGAQSYLVMPMMQDLLSLTHESARSSAGEPLLMSPLRPDAGRPISTADVVPTPPRGTVPGTNATSARPSPTVDPQLTAGWRQAEIRDSPSSRSENRPCDNRLNETGAWMRGQVVASVGCDGLAPEPSADPWSGL